MNARSNPTEAPAPPNSGADSILDHVDNALDPEKEDKETIDRFKQPFVRRAFTALLVMMFLIFVTYFISFIFQIPLPQSEILNKIIDSIVTIMKILVPDN